MGKVSIAAAFLAGLSVVGWAGAGRCDSIAPPIAAAERYVVSCPASGDPLLVDAQGGRHPIKDPVDRAIAAKACDPSLEGASPTFNALVRNSGTATIYVAFTNYTTQRPGVINWAAGCQGQIVNQQLALAPGQSCAATVPVSNGIARFCASRTQVPAGRLPNCNLAQTRNQTMIEVNFGAGANGCYPASMATCAWYDISVIPQNCTTDDWTRNKCANDGGASYNIPVALSCVGQPTYVCRGPRDGTHGSANYPSKCGDPAASCIGGSQSCDNAYFFPTPSPQPNSQCPNGHILRVEFLGGA